MRLPLRGGNWNNASNAGVCYLNLNNPRSNSRCYLGVRPAQPLAARRRKLTGLGPVLLRIRGLSPRQCLFYRYGEK